MGHIYALAGPSGAGKTTLLEELFSHPPEGLNLLLRATGRALRPGERDGSDYSFYSQDGFRKKIFFNDFVHVEQFGTSFYGIEAAPIEEAIGSQGDGIIMSGIYGASRLKTVFGPNVSIMYLYPGTKTSLLNPDSLSDSAPEMIELRRRLREKIDRRVVLVDPDGIDDYITARMRLNFVDLAYVNGRLRSGEDVLVLENLRDELPSAIEQFRALRRRTSGRVFEWTAKANSCFVLMPFSDELKPIYEDHIAPVVGRLGLTCLRADGIFSSRPVIDDVLDCVRSARIVISDLTQNNPNVFYETGFCHALGKEVILITQEEDVPFDLRHIRHISYAFSPRGMAAFERALEETLKAVLAE